MLNLAESEQALKQTLEQITALQQQLENTMSASSSDKSDKDIAGNKPDECHGSRGVAAEDCILQVELYIQLRPDKCVKDELKCLFAMGFMRGAAFTWAKPILKDEKAAERSSFETFKESFLAIIGNCCAPTVRTIKV